MQLSELRLAARASRAACVRKRVERVSSALLCLRASSVRCRVRRRGYYARTSGRQACAVCGALLRSPPQRPCQRPSSKCAMTFSQHCAAARLLRLSRAVDLARLFARQIFEKRSRLIAVGNVCSTTRPALWLGVLDSPDRRLCGCTTRLGGGAERTAARCFLSMGF